ncbi:hypothetical protein QR685DRAFT_519076 [Neurospora intermedia]|uniref:Uncharacterized protein n=1 Tax=Neurospora intermedia TaxID=5142 RepID=A0ABR3DFK6_NEUIN
MAHGSCLLACLLMLMFDAYVYTCMHFKTRVRDQTQKQGEREVMKCSQEAGTRPNKP